LIGLLLLCHHQQEQPQDAVVPSLVKTVSAAPIAKGSKISLAPPSNKSPSSATNEVSIDDPSVRMAAAPSLTRSVSAGVGQLKFVVVRHISP
jgi:hypothetical protein